MEYNLIVNQKKKSIDAIILDENLRVEISDKVYDIEFVNISEHQILLNVNGHNISTFILDDKGRKTIIIKGRSYEILNADPVEQRTSSENNFVKTPSIVSSPTPAVVIKILVKIGDIVKKGQSLIIVSAMKMETTLSSPFDGEVSGVNTKEGDNVIPADILVNVEKLEDNV